ncbi:ribosomal protein S18-alanine N-acetyltransferase [Rhodococcus sp. D2-41]|uniref:Ribosomal protein S18-alanine N-acetyltransferase n=1 Tax=Speluncibacter jeojiensis TaxID=2710754 RepID=A0A9X4M214_9ACTN|nr:ribosomal protein S18-alanine N-acetyltransferase [Rhodococcus sp. D2-41]MDG3008936.1 ribosomal protein S18-alanine N-acetyltransferase [Rhodococcus sp. D2-41]MDG3016558.1 ribosomal protein S18-alanine N-acetyltransferase [Corynebacteriales bacterium D3-21]
MTVTLDGLTEADAPRCAELERILFPGDGPWPASAFVSELRARHNHYVAARADGVLVGYAGLAGLGSARDPENEVHTIGVDPAQQGRGIGRLLLDDLLAAADARGGPVWLEVRTDNEAAIGLYRSAGFELMGLRKRYYRPSGADAYTMKRPPTGSEQSGRDLAGEEA